MVVVGQPITNPISGPTLRFTLGPELDNTQICMLMEIQYVVNDKTLEALHKFNYTHYEDNGFPLRYACILQILYKATIIVCPMSIHPHSISC